MKQTGLVNILWNKRLDKYDGKYYFPFDKGGHVCASVLCQKVFLNFFMLNGCDRGDPGNLCVYCFLNTATCLFIFKFHRIIFNIDIHSYKHKRMRRRVDYRKYHTSIKHIHLEHTF